MDFAPSEEEVLIRDTAASFAPWIAKNFARANSSDFVPPETTGRWEITV